MTAAAKHEFSAVAMGGVRKALGALGWLDAVLAAASPGTRAALQAPETSRYHPGACLDEAVALVGEQQGLEGAATLLRTVTAQSIEGVVAPLARVFVALLGNSPRVLLEKFDLLLLAAARGLSASWVAESATVGVLTLTYPVPCTPAIAHGWRGALEHLLAFCHAVGSVEVLEPGPGGTSVRLRVRWR